MFQKLLLTLLVSSIYCANINLNQTSPNNSTVSTPLAQAAIPLTQAATPLVSPTTAITQPAPAITQPTTPLTQPATALAQPPTPLAQPVTPLIQPATDMQLNHTTINNSNILRGNATNNQIMNQRNSSSHNKTLNSLVNNPLNDPELFPYIIKEGDNSFVQIECLSFYDLILNSNSTNQLQVVEERCRLVKPQVFCRNFDIQEAKCISFDNCAFDSSQNMCIEKQQNAVPSSSSNVTLSMNATNTPPQNNMRRTLQVSQEQIILSFA